MSDWKLPQLRPTGNRDADVFQRETRDSLERLKRDPLLSFSARQGVSIGVTATQVPHGLGRIPAGWQLTDITADARVWRVSWDSQFVTLQASAAVTVSLRFF